VNPLSLGERVGARGGNCVDGVNPLSLGERVGARGKTASMA